MVTSIFWYKIHILVMFHPSCIFWTKLSYLNQCGIRKCTTRFETDLYTSPHLISQSLATILIGSEVINPRVWNSFGGATFGQTHVICTLPSSLLKSHSKIKSWFEETCFGLLCHYYSLFSGGSGWKIIHGPLFLDTYLKMNGTEMAWHVL